MTVVFRCMHVVICAILLYSFPVLSDYIMCMHSLCNSVVAQCIVVVSSITKIENATAGMFRHFIKYSVRAEETWVTQDKTSFFHFTRVSSMSTTDVAVSGVGAHLRKEETAATREYSKTTLIFHKTWFSQEILTVVRMSLTQKTSARLAPRNARFQT